MSENGTETTVKPEMRPAAKPASDGRKGSPVMAFMLALLVAIAAGMFAFRFHGAVPQWMLVAGAVLGAFGLFSILGWIAGFVRFGRTSRKVAFFKNTLNAMADAAVVTDTKGRVVYANGPYRAFSEAASKPRTAGVENLYSGYPEVSSQIYRLAQAGRAGKTAHEELELPAGNPAPGANGTEPRWLRIQVEPVLEDGKQTHTLWRIVDQTEARLAQEDAFARLQYVISYLDTAPAGFFSANADGDIQYMNATLAGWLGLDLADALDSAMKVADLVPEEGAKLLTKRSGPAETTQEHIIDVDMAGAGGDNLAVRILHSVAYDDEGTAGPSRSLVLKHGSAAANTGGLGAAEARLARFFNNAPIGIAEVDEDGKIVNANNALATTAGRPVLELKITDLVTETSRDIVQESLDSARSGKRVPPADVVFGEGQNARTGQVFFSRIEDTGDAPRAIVYAVDTTEHKALELQFAQSQKMQAVGQLAGGVAHDFNNMLTAIIGFSDLLLAKQRPTDPSFQDIMNIKQNANRAANLVRQLLAFSRRQTLRPEVLSLTDTLSDLGNLLNRLLGEKVELDITHGRDLGLVKVDVNQFEQVIMNLAVNARDAMPDGGKLTIRTANIGEAESATVEPSLMAAGEYVLCEVSDTGTGMAKEVLDKIYEPFFSTKEVGKGTGLGLSTVYGIVKQTGGFVFCDSQVDVGTTFRIYLPRHFPAAEEQVEAPGEELKDVKTADLTGDGTILLVEDEDAVRAFASRALASRGYTVLEADSGIAALTQVDEHGDDIDLVISDVVMPEMDGPSLLRELRSRGIGVKIIFISGYAEDAFAKNLGENEKFAFLPKPFSLKQLAAAVKDALKS